MLIVLHGTRPHLELSFDGSVVVEFARYKSWGDKLERGMRLISRVPFSSGYAFRVSLHAAKIYDIPTICKAHTSSWQSRYGLTLMAGQDDWCIELGLIEGSSYVTAQVPRFNPDLLLRGDSSSTTLWEHLEEE